MASTKKEKTAMDNDYKKASKNTIIAEGLGRVITVKASMF